MKLKLTALFKKLQLSNWLLIGSVLLGALGQLIINQGHFFWGFACYLASAGLFVFNFKTTNWGSSVTKEINNQKKQGVTKPGLWLFLAIIILATVLRLYQLNSVPYGIDEDEARWLSTAHHRFLQKDLLGEYDPWVDYLPIGFYQIQIFNLIFGSGLMAGRLAVIFSSVLALMIFYFLVKALFNRPVALVASALLATSWVDLTTSRIIIFDNLIKPVVVGSYLFLILGLKRKKGFLFLASGAFLALGLLTFINFHLAPFIALSYFFFFCLLIRKQNIKKILIWALLILIPILVVFPRAYTYFNWRFPEKSHHLKAALFNQSDPSSPYQVTDLSLSQYLIKNTQTLLKGVFYRVDYQLQDMSYPPHPRPYEPAWLIPLAVLGFTFSLLHLGKSLWGFPAFWFLCQLFPFPIFLGYFGSRIILPAWPSFFIFASLGIYFLYHLISKILKIRWKLIPLALLFLALPLMVANYRYYFRELVIFPFDTTRSIRRDLYEILPKKINQGNFVILTYQVPPPAYISLFAERNNLDFMAFRALSPSRHRAYDLIPNNLLIGRLNDRGCHPTAVIFSKQEASQSQSTTHLDPEKWLRQNYPEIKLEPHPRLWIFNLPKPDSCSLL